MIYRQYLYICENTVNRNFLYTNGWAGLLGGGTLPVILFLGILLLATPAFCSEYSCQMDALLLASKEGRKSALHKLLIVMAGILLMCTGVSLTEYGFYSIKYGLPDGGSPIQSLGCFAGSSKDMTLFQGYVWTGLLRLFGGMFLGTLLLFLSVLAKKYAITLLGGAVAVIVPYIGLSKSDVYRLPLPLPFLLGTGYFTGDIVSRDALTGEEKMVFAEVDTAALLGLLTVSGLFCGFAVAWILRCNSNKWQMKSGKRRNAPALAVLLSLVLAVTGCSGRGGEGEDRGFVYNTSAVYDCMGYEIIQDAEDSGFYLKKTSTGETLDLVRSPLFGAFSDEEKVRALCVRPPYLYYSTVVTESHVNRVGDYNSSITKVSVAALNLDTFAEEIIFERITDSGRSLLGIEYETGDKWKFLEFHYAFFLNSDSIFFVGNDGITQVDRRAGSVAKLDIPTNGNLSFDGESIYYINRESVLAKYDVATGETTLYETIVAYDFCMDEQWIYYVSRTDGGCVYACGKDGNGRKRISKTPALSVTCDGDNIYVLDRHSGRETFFPKGR